MILGQKNPRGEKLNISRQISWQVRGFRDFFALFFGFALYLHGYLLGFKLFFFGQAVLIFIAAL